jgi:hypothetical protein
MPADAVPVRLRSQLLAPTATAALLATLLIWLGPPGTDLAAHLYQRTIFLEHGFVLWNNFWYAGRYSFITYSILYYPLAAALGIKLLAVLTVATAVGAFAIAVRREWGRDGTWSIYSFAVAWALLVLSAAYPFMLGAAFALVAICFLQRRLIWPFAACSLLTLLASPIAFLLLVVVLIGVALTRRVDRSVLVPSALTIAAVAALALLLRRMFPGRGSFPFSVEEFAAAVTFCLLGILMTWRVPRARLLWWTFVVYLVACTAAFAIASPVGENMARFRFAAAPIAILTMSLRNWRPRVLCLLVLALAVSWNVTPLAASFVHAADDPAAHAAYWTSTIDFLRQHGPLTYRVEAVDTAGHWPADFLARARIPLVRGWFRQEDFPQNEVLYGKLGPKAYIRWLQNLSVRYVVLTAARPDYSSKAEAVLLRSGRSGLEVVFRTPTATIFSVPSPRPLVTPPARVVALGYASLTLRAPAAGSYRVNVSYSPYWHTTSGCFSRTKDGMTEFQARRAGVFRLRFAVTATRALEAVVGRSSTCPDN